MSDEIFHLLHQWEEPALWECLIKWDEQDRAQLEYACDIPPRHKDEQVEAFAIADKYAELMSAKFGELLAVREAVEQIAPELAGPLDVRGPAEIGSPIDHARAVRDLVRKLKARLHASSANAVPPAGMQQGEGERPDAQSAKQLLHGWRAIDEALELSRSYPSMNYDERRRKLAYLNRRFGGPIKVMGQGSQPVVNRSELIAWWNSLEKLVEKQAEDQKARIRDKQATLRNLRPYGRTALVAPDLGGSVKRRRKSSSRTPDKT
jgi:hypothetical protein